MKKSAAAKLLWKEAAENFVLSTVMFIAILGILGITQLSLKDFGIFTSQGTPIELLKWRIPETGATNWAFIFSIPASIIGVAYILTIRNSNNFTGFYMGIVMSILLGIQFYLTGLYDLVFLYFFPFLIFQVLAILNWQSHGGVEEKTKFTPQYFSWLEMLLTFVVFLVFTVVDYAVVTLYINHDSFTDNILIKSISALLVSSSIFANFWIIFKRNDSWIYWLIYSVAGVVLNCLILNFFSIVLFTFFLFINLTAYISWVKNTPNTNYGWLQFLKKK